MTLSTIWAWFADPANWQGPDGITNRVVEHLLYTALTVAIALVLAVPVGAYVGHTGRGRWLVTGANAARAVPTLGLLFAVTMFVGPLIQSDLAFVIPSIVVLVLLAIPPLLSGTYAGVESVEPAARDAARGMGMTGSQVFTRVEAPCAMPLFLSGLRSATLQVIATATVAASVSLGGLGRYLIDGLASRDYVQMVCGSLLVAVLALVADGLLAALERYAVSPGISGRSNRVARKRAGAAPQASDDTRPDFDDARSLAATAVGSNPSERDRP